ncbi:MAG: guanylate kinase [Lachnospiraceae bacterium]|nr:guanylate kinase [Lachnospiraceae bacterium]
MRLVFYITGKSAAGKDSIYRSLLDDKELRLNPVVLYTTRPMRDGEREGKEYYFVDENAYNKLEEENKVIECRTYNTVHGPWRYFTVSSAIDNGRGDYYLGIGTLESFIRLRDHYGDDRMVPIYIEVEDGDRLIRAIERERASGRPDYKEMCRRYIADDEDFSEAMLSRAGIRKDLRFENKDLTECTRAVRRTIIGYQSK